jgi:hypothetical protein
VGVEVATFATEESEASATAATELEATTFAAEVSEGSETAAPEVDDSVRRNESDEDLIVDVSVKLLLVRVLEIIFIFLVLRCGVGCVCKLQVCKK